MRRRKIHIAGCIATFLLMSAVVGCPPPPTPPASNSNNTVPVITSETVEDAGETDDDVTDDVTENGASALQSHDSSEPEIELAGPQVESDDELAAETDSDEPETEHAEAAAVDQVSVASPGVSDAESIQFVDLPSSELTAGIPGEGPLTVDQVRDWLAQGENHRQIAPKLPLGLDEGVGQLFIPSDNPLTKAKIELGRQLYFDTRMSGDGTISCASCHHPDHGFAKPDQFGVGIDGQTGNRNSPVSYNRLLSQAQFWDGRAATLEDQAVGPIANPIEHGTTHEEAVAAIAAVEAYQLQFERIFGPDRVNIDNIGKAIASFERVIVTGPSANDYYKRLLPFLDYEAEDLEDLKEDSPNAYANYEAAKAGAEQHPMTEAAIRGRELFFSEKVACTACHVGANFTDEKFHNLGVGMDQEEPDPGRFKETNDEKDRGAFKTPTVRNVAITGPYMHDGSQKTLEEVVEWYAKGGHPNPHLSDKIKKIELSDQDKQDLVEYMHALTGEFPKVEPGRLP